MKKMNNLFNIVLLLLLSTGSFAQNDNDNDNDDKAPKRYDFEQKKTYSKSYNLSSSDKVSIDNRFGSVEIHTWAKSEIKVDIELKTTAKTEEWAKAVLSDLDVEDSKSGGVVKFKTLFSEDLDKKEGGNKHRSKYEGKDSRQTLEINYVVYMPSGNPLEIENEFGPTIIPDYTGEVELTSKFGKLETGNLTNVKNINVEFGKAKFGNLSGGNISIKYSKAGFARLSGRVKMGIEFSNKITLNLDNNLSALDLRVSYSTINIKPSSDLAAGYTVSTSFGSFRNRTAVKFTSDADDDDDRRGPKFDYEYTGKNGSGAVPVKVKSDFSTIIIGDATEEDFHEKGKRKSKSKAEAV